MHPSNLLILLFLFSFAANSLRAQDSPFNSSQRDYPDWSPFTGVRWEDTKPFVRIVGQSEWYKIQTIHGLPIDAILAHCKLKGWDPKRRFTQDPIQVIRLMGHKIEKTTSLQLQDKTGKISTIKNVKMTAEARKQCVHPFNRLPSNYPSWSPFVDIKWERDKPFVRVEGLKEWFELIAIHKIKIDKIAKVCEENSWDLKRRLAEDAVQLIRLMGYSIDKTTTLKLRDASGKIIKQNDVKMSAENLRRLFKNRSK